MLFRSGIKAVAMGNNCVFGLKRDGTVVATTEGRNGAKFSSAPDVTTWRNIVAIRTNWPSGVMGIDKNGRVVIVNRNYYGRCESMYTIWNDGIIDQEDQADNVDKFIRQAKKYLHLEKLTPAVLNDLVKAVYVHAPDKSSGHRVQDVEISYNYIGILPATLLYN